MQHFDNVTFNIYPQPFRSLQEQDTELQVWAGKVQQMLFAQTPGTI